MGGSECTTLARSTKRFGFAQGCDRCQWRTGRFWKYLVESYRTFTAQRALVNYITLFITEKRGAPRNDGIYTRISLRNQRTSFTVHGSIILHNMCVVWYTFCAPNEPIAGFMHKIHTVNQTLYRIPGVLHKDTREIPQQRQYK